MPDQNQPKAPAFNPKLKDAIVALKAENNPKNLNAVLNELVRSPLLAPANFDLQGQSVPTPGPAFFLIADQEPRGFVLYFWFCHIGAAALDPCQASFLFKQVQRLTHRGAAYPHRNR